MLDRLNDILGGTGLFTRGGFHCEVGDNVPILPDGRIARTLLLVGNAGPEMWRQFEKERNLDVKDPLDSWLLQKLEKASRATGAHLLLPNSGPPFIPLQDWAMRAEPVFRSPIGIMIHPEFGLWHVYRAVLLFAEHIDLPAWSAVENPCDACEAKPCRKVCPADAFTPSRFDAFSCVLHVESAAGRNCRELGCLARRACPVGRRYLYDSDQQKFHTEAMVRAVRLGCGSEDASG
ncbi:MAG: hypothetical protein VX007_05410 [Pseudomonadota bacterium]|nr:hypothetical protein [Pseudomonadota bacterium]